MTYTYSVTYLPCQICNARIHCDHCESQLEKSILRISGVHSASLNMATKSLLADITTDQDAFLDALEVLGLFSE